MMTENLKRNLKRLHRRINGSTLEYNLKPYYGKLIEIKKYEAQLKTKTDHQLKELSKRLVAQARKGLSLDQLLIKAYALVSAAIDRVLKLNPFDTQLIGAIVDEADSILIDEARIPLIIAAASDDYVRNTFLMAEIARNLEKGVDIEFDNIAAFYWKVPQNKWYDSHCRIIRRGIQAVL